MMRLLIHLAWILAACFLPPVTAETPAPTAQPACCFSVHDTNGDGYLNALEFYQLRREILARRGPGHRPPPVHSFNEFDLDGDGLISETELTDRIGRGTGRRSRHRLEDR